jgi:tRNA(Leu) C34 or U34 (ribose-2'-O)-methylase TrmL
MTTNILLINPKFARNVGTALRAASCFGADSVFWTGTRVSLDVGKGERLPREERMRQYRGQVHLERLETVRPVDVVAGTPVAIELVPGAEDLPDFEHPADARYIFGPEDGSLPKGIRTVCHRFVKIPSLHCVNLASAVYLTLYDRMVKAGTPYPTIAEEYRGWDN